MIFMMILWALLRIPKFCEYNYHSTIKSCMLESPNPYHMPRAEAKLALTMAKVIQLASPTGLRSKQLLELLFSTQYMSKKSSNN